MKNTRLVYSTDPKDNVVCPKCRKFDEECICISEEEVLNGAYTVVFRLEKSGRGGKTVTVMEGFPRNTDFLASLTKELKSKCGVGGSFSVNDKFGLIEIQGDSREKLKKILITKQIKYKGV